MFGYIYKTTNKITNRCYIGKHKADVFDESYYGSGILLRRAIKKHGKINFEIEVIEECDSLEQLNEREMFWISHYDAAADINFYNISYGGDGGAMPPEIVDKATKKKIGKKIHSKEFKEKMSNISKACWENEDYRNKQKLNHKGMLNRKHTEETKRKMSISKKGQFAGEKNPMYGKVGAFKGKTHTEETKMKISESRKGKLVGADNPMYGKPRSQAVKDAVSKANKGRKLTQERKDEISKTMTGKKRGTYKRRYDCVCKKCGTSFEGLAWNSGMCNTCKGR